MSSHLHGSARRKFLQHEILENRSMLAADCSAFQNPFDSNDLNDDGAVSPADALVAINTINGGFTGDLSAKFAPPSLQGVAESAVADYLDATGDGHLSAADALAVINAINSGGASAAIRDLPLEDASDDTPDAVGDQNLLGDRSFGKVLGVINEAGDVDFFRIVPGKTNLNITFFSIGRTALTVDLVKVDPSDPSADANGIVELDSASTTAGSRERARINFDVTVGEEYFLRVQGTSGTETGAYGLAVLNYTDDQFKPVDSEPEGDQHGDGADDATELPLRNRNAHVIAHIDPAGDADYFKLLNLTDGKLLISARGQVPVTVEVFDAEGKLVSDLLPRDHRVAARVTATGTYFVKVTASDEAETGAYRLHIVNIPIRPTTPQDPGSALEALFARLDTDDDEVLSKAEVKVFLPLEKVPLLDRIFTNWDADQDGELDFAEFEAGVDRLHERAPLREPVKEIVDRLRRR